MSAGIFHRVDSHVLKLDNKHCRMLHQTLLAVNLSRVSTNVFYATCPSSPLAVFQHSSHALITPNFSENTCYGRVERHTHGSSLSSCRLYSDYLYFGIANKSAEDFHEKVSESLQLFEGCLTEYTMRSCVYNTTVNNAMPVSAHTHTRPC